MNTKANKSMNIFLSTALIFFCTTTENINAKVFFSPQTYTKKAPYAGMGKQSKHNSLIKTKGISGHGKRTKKGYTYVNPYARSK